MDDEGESPSIAPGRASFARYQELRGIRARVDALLRSYWRTLVAECEPFAEAALVRAEERYAKYGPPFNSTATGAGILNWHERGT
jgi:hypothetical protein